MRTVVALGCMAAAVAFLPYRWSHVLTPTCFWASRPVLGAVSLREPGIREAEMRLACLRGRGLKSAEPVRVILSRWPHEGER